MYLVHEEEQLALLVWLAFIAGPLVIGLLRLLPSFLNLARKTVLVSEIFGITFTGVYLLTLFVRFRPTDGTVYFWQFIFGCLVGICVNVFVEWWINRRD